MLAAYLAATGRTVDVVTSTAYLAIRDAQEYEAFYSDLGLTVKHISNPSGLATPEQFDASILYGVNTDFEFAIMRDGLYGGQRLPNGSSKPICSTQENRFMAHFDAQPR